MGARHPGAAGRGALVRGALCSVVILLAVVGPPLLAAEATARLGAASGTVAVVRADGSALQPAGPGTPLGPGDRIATVGRSSATLDLPGLGQIELGAESTIILRELRMDGADVVLVAEVVQGMTVHRLSPASGSQIEYRIVGPSGQAVARALGGASFGVGRDENGNVTVACERCPSGTLSFPAAGQWLASGRSRTLTARGEVVESSLGGSIFDALANGASADDDGSTTPSTARLPEGQRTGSRDDRRRIDNDDDDDAQNAPSRTARILSPTDGQAIAGSTVEVRWEAPGFTIVPAGQARRREDVHAHLLLDRDPAPYLGSNRPIPLDDPNIVHTGSLVVTFRNVTDGTHRVYLVLATADHVALSPPVTDVVTFTVSSSAATVTPTPAVTPTPTPTPTQAPGAVEATIANFVYLPDPIQIQVGQTVRWINLDPDIHTVTANDQSWTSPILTQGQTYQWTFTQAGTFPYFCEPHPFMQGVVEVSP